LRRLASFSWHRSTQSFAPWKYLEDIMRDERTNRAVPLTMASAVMLMLVACGPADLVVPVAYAQTPSPAPAPPPTRNPTVETAVATVDKVLADPSKKEALCTYARARGAVGAAMSNHAAGTTGRNPVQRERQQIDQLRALGGAQGAERQAAGAVDPEFYNAVEILRVGDYMQAIRVDLALQALCKPQQ
jgi:hypothetical protein